MRPRHDGIVVATSMRSNVQISLQLSECHQPPRSFWPRLFLAFASRSCMSAGTWGRSVEPKRSASTCTVPAILSSVCAERCASIPKTGRGTSKRATTWSRSPGSRRAVLSFLRSHITSARTATGRDTPCSSSVPSAVRTTGLPSASGVRVAGEITRSSAKRMTGDLPASSHLSLRMTSFMRGTPESRLSIGVSKVTRGLAVTSSGSTSIWPRTSLVRTRTVSSGARLNTWTALRVIGSSTMNVVRGMGPPGCRRSSVRRRENSASCLFAPKPVGYSPMTPPPRFVTLPEMRRAAHARLPRDVWNFGAGGAETETSRRRNRRALDRLAITQNILVDVRQIDLRTSLLGVPLSWPVAVAPMGGLVLFHPERDIVNRYDPREAMKVAPNPRGPDSSYQARLTWDDVAWLQKTTKLPVGIKGIMTVRDARRAVDMGVRIIWVSNHGGRQLDHTEATIDALPRIADAVGGRAEVLVAGGFSRG